VQTHAHTTRRHECEILALVAAFGPRRTAKSKVMQQIATLFVFCLQFAQEFYEICTKNCVWRQVFGSLGNLTPDISYIPVISLSSSGAPSLMVLRFFFCHCV
jgi:hypothetical protein